MNQRSAVEVLFICNDIVQAPTDDKFISSVEQKEKIANKLMFPGVLSPPGISLLIRSDQLWTITRNEVRCCKGNNNLTAINTSFGWTFQGSMLPSSLLTGSPQLITSILCVGSLDANNVGLTQQSIPKFRNSGLANQPSYSS